MDKIAKKESI